MNKTSIKIPRGIQYISEWKDYEIPRGSHYIIDKGVTGCGYTEMCLRNKDNIILCSPRKLLLENKLEQHKDDENIYYLVNLGIGYDEMRERIKTHIDRCERKGLPIKILITYDSTHYVIDYLRYIKKLGDFIFVVDEFQSIFLDSYFKTDVELSFVHYLQDCKSVIYLSATPMLDEYLEMMPEFKNLDFQFLDWSESGYVEKIVIQRKRTNSLGLECNRIIKDYLSGKFPIRVDSRGEIKESREAVFYLNSLEEIIRIVKKNKLTSENTLIICSDKDQNIEKLKKIKFKIGRIPIRGEKYPMFIFCTSAVYMGVDFYSSCASSYIFADPNVNSLALDISLDLPQIIGRQRDKTNIFKNNIVIFYKTKKNDITDLTEENHKILRKKKRDATITLLKMYDNLATEKERLLYKDKLISDLLVSRYSKDYVGFSGKTGEPVYNSLIEIADDRAWKIAQKDYQDSLNVTRALEESGFINLEDYFSEDGKILKDFLDNYFYATGVFHEKMKLYCEFRDKYGSNEEILDGLLHKITDPKFDDFYRFYGTKGCSAREYRLGNLLEGFNSNLKEDNLEKAIKSVFKVGDRLTNSKIKENLKEIYSSLGINKIAKTGDLEKYFNLKRTQITVSEKDQKNGFKLEEKIL